MKLLLIIFLFALFTRSSFQATSLVMSTYTANPTTIGSSSALSFTVSTGTGSTFTLPASATFVFPFPASFSCVALPTCTVSVSSTVSASSFSATYPCTVPTSTNQVSITTTIPAAVTTVSSMAVKITGFTNAKLIDYTIDSSNYFSFSILDSTTTTASVTVLTNRFALSKGKLSQCSLSSSSNIVGASTTLTLTLVTANIIPSNGVIRLQSPTWNAYATDSASRYYATSSTTCTGVSGASTSLSCTFDSSTGNITMSNGFSSAVSGTIIITLTNMRNPLNTGPSGSFLLDTLTSASGTILEYCDSMTFSVSTPGTLTAWAMTCENTQINAATGLCDLIFTLQNPLPPLGDIIITVPSQMTVTTLTLNTALPITYFDVFCDATFVGNIITLKDIVPSSASTSAPAGTTIDLRIGYLTNPSSLSTTSSFVVTTYLDSYSIDTQTSGFTYAATQAGTLTVNSITAADTTAGFSTSYSFSLTTSNTIANTGGITITFPSVFTLSSTCSITAHSSNINAASPTCTADTTNLKITLSALWTSSLAGGSTVTFTISGITNPGNTKPTTVFTFSTLQDTTSSSSIIDQDKTMTISFITAGPLPSASASITPGSYVTSTATPFTFAFKNFNPCTSGGGVVIKIPTTAISFASITSTQSSLSSLTNINSAASVVITTSGSNYVITLTNAFSTTYVSGTSFSFQLLYIKTAPTVEPITGITYSTYTSDNYAIDTLSPGLTLTMTTAHAFNTLSVIPTTLINGASGSFEVDITLDNAHYNGDIITIVFPTVITLALTSTSTATGSVSGVTVTGIQSSNSAIVTLATSSSSIATGSTLKITVSALKNTGFYQSLGTFTVSSTDSAGFARSSSTYLSSSLKLVEAQMPMPSTNVIPYNTITSQTGVNYQFTVDRVNDQGSGGYITVQFPSEITAPTSPTCSNFGGISSIACTTTGNIVKVTGSFDALPTDLIFNISGITNPSISVSGSFVLSTYTSGDYLVDQRTTDLRFNAACDNPCSTCLTTSRTSCTSCFTDSTATLTLLYGTTCVATCPTGTVNIGGTCKDCTSPCSQCQTTQTTCTSCISTPTQYYLYGSTCLTTCPDTYYQDTATLTCAACDTTCSRCENYDECLSCPSGKVLYNKNCLSSCPALITIDAGGYCTECDAICDGCTGTTSTCVDCATGYFLYNGKCIQECAATLYFSASSGTCKPCTSPCLTCTTAATTCTSCVSGEYLYGNQCVDTCTTGYYKDMSSGSGVCTKCPTGCSACSNELTCTACSSTYYLYSGSCVTSCPTGTLASSSSCVSCNTGCASCLGTTTYCTSCSTNYQYNSVAHTCSASCATKQYEDDSTTPYTCKSCATTCATCDGGTSSDCLSCSNGPYPFLTPSTTCATSCPSYYYGDTSSNKCVGCNAACSACTGALATTCTACNPNFYLYGTTCVTTCPTTSILVGTTCKSCDSNCLTCSSTTTNCVTCNSGYTKTLDTDTAEYYCKKDITITDPETGTNTTTTITTSSSGVLDSGVVPFPFLIAAFIFLVAVLGAKSAVPVTVIPGNLLAFWSYLLFSVGMTWVLYMLYKYDDWQLAFDADTNLPILLIIAGLIMNYVNNFIHLLIIYSTLRKDPAYREWRDEKLHKRVFRASITISTLTTFKVFRLTYNKFLGFKCLSAHMSSVASLKPIYYLTIFNVVSSVLPFTAGAAYKIKDGFTGDQLSVFTVEIIILSALCIILCFCDIAKTRDFYAPHPPEPKTATDANKSKMGLLDDESRIDLDPDMYMAGTDNLKPAPDTKGLGPNPRFQTPQNKHPRKKNQQQQPIDNPVSFRDSGQKLLKNANNEEPDSVFDRSGNDVTRAGNNDSKSIFLKSKMKNYILSQDTPAETDEILQRNVLTEGSNEAIKGGQGQNGGTSNTLPDENKLSYIKSITALRSSNPNATEFKRKVDISESPIHASSIEKLSPKTPGDQIFVVEDQASPDGLIPRNGGGSPRITQKNKNAGDPGAAGKSSNVSNQALASDRPSYRASSQSNAKNIQGQQASDRKNQGPNTNPNANSKTLPPTNPSSKVKPSSPVPSHNNRSASPTIKNKNGTTVFETKRSDSPSTNNRAQSPGTRAKTPGTNPRTAGTNPKTPNTNRVSINSKKGITGPEETRGAAGNSVNQSRDSVISHNPLVDPNEKVFSPVNKIGGAGTHLAFPNPERAAANKNNQQSPSNSPIGRGNSPVIKQMSTISHKESRENLTDNASDGIEPLGITKNFATTNNLSVIPRGNNNGDPTSNRLSNEFNDFEKLEAGSFVPSERSAMAYDHNMSGITEINRPGNSMNPHIQSGESLPQGAKSHLMDSKEYSQNFEKKASTTFLRSLFNKKNNAVQPIDSSSPKRNNSSKTQARFVTEGLSEQPSAPQLNSPDKTSIVEKSPELKRANTQRVGTAGSHLGPASKNRGSKTPNKISSATLYQSGNLESVKDENYLDDDSRMREPEIDFSEDSKISMEELDNFAYEDTPSNYNQLNQRFEGESKYIHSRSYLNSKNSQFAKVGTNGNRKILPQLSGQSSLQGDLNSFEKKGTTLYARVETSTPSTNNFMNKSSKLPDINKK